MKDNSEAGSGPGRARRRGVFGRFCRDRSGATAIEFAMLVIPFSLLVFAILESCIAFAAQQVISNATDDVARQLRTGQIRPGVGADKLDEAKLKTLLCDRIKIMVAKDCPGLVVDLRKYDTFADAAAAGFKIVNKEIVLTKNGVADPTTFSVDPGASKTKNMLRVFYKWPVITDFLRASMSNLSDGKTLQFATVTWQNEPFND
ncbi:TadE/TadG family type IV pilus assembly protein [Mesorhizobium sp. YR577]|uniref:TadE/TadG family type IV pilus assembly protein n=1 Tax=Mesorhizobium sp. YR577 TaxID=1884373 RepID=UPI0008EDD5B6|nr:TadE/TadG family type IV pilus assembly protein [Mesorhizobium sp. YR577]SFT62990.1 Flp pilus assembly protein TadG [Mesorhizobium sp. YR577]